MGRHQVVVNEKTDTTVGERAKESMLIGVGCNHIVTCRGSRHFICGDDDDTKKKSKKVILNLGEEIDTWLLNKLGYETYEEDLKKALSTEKGTAK